MDILEAVLRAHFGSEGEHIQLNVVDNETLRDAQAHPENYRNLLVRVAGYSAFFVDLEESIQENIIERTIQKGRLNPQPSAACHCRKRRMRERQAPGQQQPEENGRPLCRGKNIRTGPEKRREKCCLKTKKS